MEAVIKGHLHVCDYLITEENANLEAVDNNRRTPLILAAIFNKTEIMKLLLQHNANIEARDDDQSTALIYAACWNNTELLKILLQHNANIMAQNNRGCHAAYFAANNGHLEALKILVEKDGAVIDLRGWNGETPLIAASRLGMADVCEYLVEEKNANIELRDCVGKTAFQRAEDPTIILLLSNINENHSLLESQLTRFYKRRKIL